MIRRWSPPDGRERKLVYEFDALCVATKNGTASIQWGGGAVSAPIVAGNSLGTILESVRLALIRSGIDVGMREMRDDVGEAARREMERSG